MALIILLDQFSRSVWRDDSRAFTQDPHALSLATEGCSSGHYASLEMPWFRVIFCLSLGHCEGPDHFQRFDMLITLREDVAAAAPLRLRPIYTSLIDQAREVRRVIAAFGRHPHRNEILSRTSTAAEGTYIADGRFPHERAFHRNSDTES